MSALDHLHTRAAAASEALDLAEALARRASGKAEELESIAVTKSWTGVTRGISRSHAELDRAIETIRAAQSVTGTGRGQLTAITDEMSSERVALELAEIRDCFESAGRAARQALESVTEAHTFAGATDATSVTEMTADLKDQLADGDRALTTAIAAVESEHGAATAWGSGTATGGGGVVPRLPTGEPLPIHVRYPGNVRGALGDHFRPGVQDEGGVFDSDERATADWLMARYPGASVHARKRDPAAKEKSPDAVLRMDPQDTGTITEWKTLLPPADETSTTSRPDTAVQGALRAATRQVVARGNGHVVIDGRPADLSEASARQGHARYVGTRKHHRRPIADQITIILGDGRALDWRTDD